MNLHKTTHMEESWISNETSDDCELKSDTLDELYKEQLTDLRDLIFKTAQASDIEICRKWIKVFNRTSKSEKMARNCLCTLMQQQMKEYKCLGEPFTNLQNCNRDLECVLRRLDDGESYRSSNASFPSRSNVSFKSHCINMPNVVKLSLYDCPQNNVDMFLNECHHNELTNETMELKRELDSLRLQLTEKQIENVQLKEIADKYRFVKDEDEKKLDNIKQIILDGIREKLLDFKQCGMYRPQIRMFEVIFNHFSNDEEFMDILRNYDMDFQHILSKHFECEFNKRKTEIVRHICRKFNKSKTKMREKYERRLMMQAFAQKLQLKLSKHKCFSVLRQIFISAHSEFGKIETWEVLKTLEEKYQSVVNDDTN